MIFGAFQVILEGRVAVAAIFAIDRHPMIWMIIHVGGEVFFIIKRTIKDVKAFIVANLAVITLGYAAIP